MLKKLLKCKGHSIALNKKNNLSIPCVIKSSVTDQCFYMEDILEKVWSVCLLVSALVHANLRNGLTNIQQY